MTAVCAWKTVAAELLARNVIDGSNDACSAFANRLEDFHTVQAFPCVARVYVRVLPTKRIDAVHDAGKRVRIAGPIVVGRLLIH